MKVIQEALISSSQAHSAPKAKNCFDLLRTIAALAVLFSHSFTLSGLPEPVVGRGVSLGTLAVWVFFAISGYLIVISRVTSISFSSFIIKRILRIFPALITVLVLSALVVGPVLSELSIAKYFSHRQTWSYVAMISPENGQPDLLGVFLKNPFRNSFNGSLWTIKYEILMYLILGLLPFLSILPMRIIVTTLAISLWCLTCAHESGAINLNRLFWRLEKFADFSMASVCLLGCIFFTAAALALRTSNRIPSSTAALSLLIIILLSETYLFKPAAAIIIPIVTIYLATQGPTHLVIHKYLLP